ncbi:MAG: hypothetical protein Q7J78_03450 [Clostridiales bacterium]|nr:hypothetical protein [Clostridiales bacterium]
MKELFPDPMVEVTGSHYVDVTVNRKEGKLAVNLLNTAAFGGFKNPEALRFECAAMLYPSADSVFDFLYAD